MEQVSLDDNQKLKCLINTSKLINFVDYAHMNRWIRVAQTDVGVWVTPVNDILHVMFHASNDRCRYIWTNQMTSCMKEFVTKGKNNYFFLGDEVDSLRIFKLHVMQFPHDVQRLAQVLFEDTERKQGFQSVVHSLHMHLLHSHVEDIVSPYVKRGVFAASTKAGVDELVKIIRRMKLFSTTSTIPKHPFRRCKLISQHLDVDSQMQKKAIHCDRDYTEPIFSSSVEETGMRSVTAKRAKLFHDDKSDSETLRRDSDVHSRALKRRKNLKQCEHQDRLGALHTSSGKKGSRVHCHFSFLFAASNPKNPDHVTLLTGENGTTAIRTLNRFVYDSSDRFVIVDQLCVAKPQTALGILEKNWASFRLGWKESMTFHIPARVLEYIFMYIREKIWDIDYNHRIYLSEESMMIFSKLIDHTKTDSHDHGDREQIQKKQSDTDAQGYVVAYGRIDNPHTALTIQCTHNKRSIQDMSLCKRNIEWEAVAKLPCYRPRAICNLIISMLTPYLGKANNSLLDKTLENLFFIPSCKMQHIFNSFFNPYEVMPEDIREYVTLKAYMQISPYALRDIQETDSRICFHQQIFKYCSRCGNGKAREQIVASIYPPEKK